MSKISSYRIIPAIMAMMVFFSTAGIFMNMHYCQGDLKNVTIFGKAKSCHEMTLKVSSAHCKKMQKSCHAAPDSKNDKGCKSGCCNQKSFTVQVNKPFTVESNIEFNDFQQQSFVVAFVSTYLNTNWLTHKAPVFATHIPPPLSRDLTVLNQRFLL